MAKESYQKLKNDIRAFFSNTTVAPVGSTFDYAGGTITKTGSSTAQFTGPDGQAIVIYRNSDPAAVANRSPTLARYWADNYQVPWAGSISRGGVGQGSFLQNNLVLIGGGLVLSGIIYYNTTKGEGQSASERVRPRR